MDILVAPITIARIIQGWRFYWMAGKFIPWGEWRVNPYCKDPITLLEDGGLQLHSGKLHQQLHEFGFHGQQPTTENSVCGPVLVRFGFYPHETFDGILIHPAACPMHIQFPFAQYHMGQDMKFWSDSP